MNDSLVDIFFMITGSNVALHSGECRMEVVVFFCDLCSIAPRSGQYFASAHFRPKPGALAGRASASVEVKLAAWLLLVFPQSFSSSSTVSTWHQYCYIVFMSRTAPRLFSCASISHDGLRCLFERLHKDTVRTDDFWSLDEQNHNAEKGHRVG